MQTDVSITRIAAELGYSTPANFSRAFRNATGLNPSALRAAAGMSHDEIISEFPELTAEDIRAALANAADRDRRIVTAGAAPHRPAGHFSP